MLENLDLDIRMKKAELKKQRQLEKRQSSLGAMNAQDPSLEFKSDGGFSSSYEQSMFGTGLGWLDYFFIQSRFNF